MQEQHIQTGQTQKQWIFLFVEIIQIVQKQKKIVKNNYLDLKKYT